ncbi:MAG TPA: hypothetical protein DIT07_04910 [Sphingobacteriaceae bacterium]|nr:hypothetical protein [Sphingobacteriaceae bacterium]
MKKGYYFLIGLVLLLLFTNPSLDNFKREFSVSNESEIIIRHNHFLFNTYNQKITIEGEDYKLNYFGFLTTFLVYR